MMRISMDRNKKNVNRRVVFFFIIVPLFSTIIKEALGDIQGRGEGFL
jgi:hypothetical protein